jgi:CHAD domain-containing protein
MATTHRFSRPRPASGSTRLRTVFARDFERRTRILHRLSRAPRRLSADDVHDLRVTTRRLRESISMLRECGAGAGTARARRELRALGRALGACRTLDIAIEDARTYRVDAGPLEKKRVRAYGSLYRLLRPARTRRLVDDLRRAQRGIVGAPFERLLHHLQHHEWEIAYRLAAPPRTAAERHRLRVEMKKVRYMIESVGRKSASLRRLQDHLGREHDLAVLQELVGRVPRAGRDGRLARARAQKALAPALRSAMRQLRAMRGDISR